MAKVYQKKVNTNLNHSLEKIIQNMGGISQYIKAGERVLVKPNFNTADPFPASSDPQFLAAALRVIYQTKPGKVILGESCTFSKRTSKVMDRIGVSQLEQEFPDLEILNFDEDNRWVKKDVPDGKFLNSIQVPAVLDEVDRVVYLPCLKTHKWAQYTGALKLSIGFLTKKHKTFLHTGHLQEKIVELNTLIQPDLVIMDARKCFITKGPSSGEIREPNLILASTSRIVTDIAGIKIIQQFEGNDLAEIEAQELTQIAYARELGVE